jgi:hypothetical protein
LDRKIKPTRKKIRRFMERVNRKSLGKNLKVKEREEGMGE